MIANIRYCKFCNNNYIGNRCHCWETDSPIHKPADPDEPKQKTYGRCAVCNNWMYIESDSIIIRNDGKRVHDYCYQK